MSPSAAPPAVTLCPQDPWEVPLLPEAVSDCVSTSAGRALARPCWFVLLSLSLP